jgi:hypothetical protein
MRRSLSFLLAVAVLVASATAVAAQGRGRGGERGPPAEIGAFVAENDSVTGEHLSFSFSDAGIEGFRAQNITLFDVAVTGETEDDDDADDDDRDEEQGRAPRVIAEGSFFRVRTQNFTFSAHDNPGAVSKLDADGTFVITFARGVVLSAGENGTVRFTVAGINGTLRGDELATSGQRVSGVDDALLYLDAPRGEFDVHREDIGEAIAKGHVGAEASFNARPADAGQNASDDAPRGHEQEVVSYGNVTMTTVKAERGNLTVLVEGHGLEGRVLVLNVDGRMIGADRADKLNITLDNESIEPASTLEDALDPDDDGFDPEYYIVWDPTVEAFQLIVTVPHYSVHTLTVATLVEILPPSVTAGILVGVLVVVPMALVLFRRK